MQTPHRSHATLVRAVLLAAAIVTAQAPAWAEGSARAVVQVAQADEAPQRELQPRYEPVPPQPKSWYNSSYIFAATRGVADSPMMPVAKAPLFLLAVPLDIVLLPFTVIGGFFG